MRETYSINEKEISIVTAPLDRTYDVPIPGSLKSVWVYFSAALTLPLILTIGIKDEDGDIKELLVKTIAAGERQVLLFYDNEKGYPLGRNRMLDGSSVYVDQIVVKTNSLHLGLSAKIQIICK